MGLMDKLKEQAGQVADKAQKGAAQAQARFEQVQAKRGSDALLRDLGAAYYAEQRQGGPRDAVEQALSALDAHAADVGDINTSTAGPQPSPSSGGSVPGDAPAGDFKLD